MFQRLVSIIVVVTLVFSTLVTPVYASSLDSDKGKTDLTVTITNNLSSNFPSSANAVNQAIQLVNGAIDVRLKTVDLSVLVCLAAFIAAPFFPPAPLLLPYCTAILTGKTIQGSVNIGDDVYTVIAK